VSKKIITYIILFIPIPIWLFYLLSVYPGILTPDSLDQWNQAITFNFNNWHPIFHTLMNWSLIKIYNSPATICIAQILSLTLVNLYGYKVFTKSKNNNKYGTFLLILITFFVTLNPINGYMINTLWKDIFFSISFLLLELIYVDIIINNTKITSTKFIVILITLFSVYNLRHNGPATSFLFILFYYLSTKNLKISSSLIIGLMILIFFYNSILLKNILKINNTDKPPITDNLIHYQLAIMKDDGKMSDKTINLLKSIDPNRELVNNFNNYYTGYITFAKTIDKDFVKLHKKELLYNTIDTILKNPIIFLKELSKMNSIILSIRIPADGYLNVAPSSTFDYLNDSNLKDIYNHYNLKHNPLIDTKLSNTIYEFTIKYKNTIWNLSILFYLNIIFLMVLTIKKIKFKYITPLLLIILPTIITGVVVPSQDYRYFYILILSLPFMIFYSFLVLKKTINL